MNLFKKIFTCAFIEIILIVSFGGIYYLYGLNKISFAIAVLLTIANVIYNFFNNYFERTLNFIVKYRFCVFLVIFVFLVVFKIHGSSIGMYDFYYNEKIDNNKNSIMLGQFRPIRSDEWAVMTPYYFSQNYNDYNKISHHMSIDGQNMIIGYNSPVKDITILGKPLVWGYMLLGNEYGLSWYWCLKTIFILLAAFEMCYIITKKSKKASILGSLLITFGPATQWWFSPHMPDVILWAMVLFDFVYHFFTHKKKWVRNLLTIITPFVAMQFVIALFPSFQVGLGYLLLFVFIALIFRDRIKLFEDKWQIIRDIILVILSLSLIGYFVVTNIDALKATMNTAYPGARIDTGGNFVLKDLFTDLATPFLSYFNSSPYINQSEDSTFIHIGIFILMLAPLLIYKLKKDNDKNWIVGLSLSILILINIGFMLIGFPEILAKITFYSYINRMKMILGFIFIIYSIWGIVEISKLKEKINIWYYLICVLIYCLLLVTFIDDDLLNYLPKYIYLVEICFIGLLLILLRTNKSGVSYAMLGCLLLFSSLTINPIVTGISSVTNHPSSKAISNIIKKDNKSYWIGTDWHVSYLMMNGAKAFNHVNFYPDYGKWKIIDKDGSYDELYNRYAHINILISEDGESSVLPGDAPDCVKLKLTLEMMYKFNIKYIFTSNDLSSIIEDDYRLELIYKDNDVKIYEIKEVK